MQMVKKIIFVLLIVWLGFLIFMPKTSLYNTLQAQLAKKDIKINEKSIEEGLFSLKLKDVTVYVKGIDLIHIDKIDLFTLLFYNSVTIDNIIVDDVLHTSVPEHIVRVKAVYSLIKPWYVKLDTNGSFGVAKGKIKLKKKKVHLDLLEVNKIDKIKSILKKNEKGWFYEKTF